MRVVHCLNDVRIGGIERLVLDLVKVQLDNGLDVTILVDRLEGLFVDQLNSIGVQIIVSGIRNGFDINRAGLRVYRRVFNECDIIHLHTFSLLRFHFAIRSKAKVVYTVHGISKGIRDLNGKNLLREYLKKWCTNNVDKVVGNSKFTLEVLKEQYNLNKVSSLVIDNGINIDNASTGLRSRLNNNDELIVGVVSRLVQRKRLDRLINGFDLFLEFGGKGKLFIVGDGPLRVALVEQVRLRGLEDDIIFMGFQTNMNEVYDSFDVCVFPSEKEPFGLVALEAYLKGLPVIAFSDSGGLKEIIELLDWKNIVCDEEDLANRLLLMSHLSSDELFSLERIELVKAQYSMKKMYESYLEVYKSIINI